MCGIAGGVGLSPPTQVKLDNQLRALEHRGPDSKGSKLGKKFSLGMCRLAINEIQDGKQPVSDESDQVHLVFNGEIYNYKNLQKKYFPNGRMLQNGSEAALMIGLYKLHGIDFVNELEGMFAIALFDESKEELRLIRDRLGKKPLCYSISEDQTIYFASETKALLSVIQTKTLCKSALTEVMTFGYVLGPQTAFSEIQFLPPGHIGTYKNGAFTTKQYWEPKYDSNTDISYADAKEETKRLIINSVGKRLISERPLGSFLSGGIDSTVVTAVMAQLSPGYVNTFSIGFEDKHYDESKYALEIAKHLKTNHKYKIVKPNPAALLERISQTLDQPFADSSIIPTFELAEFASHDVVVALGGDGGDEVFAGYDRYRAAPTLQKFSSTLKFLGPIAPILSRAGIIRNRRINRLLSEMEFKGNLTSTYRSIMSLTKPNQLVNLLQPDFYDSQSINEFDESFELQGPKDDLHRMLKSDLLNYLPGDLLVKADLASMAHGLELRSPLLDIQLIEWVNQLPTKYKIEGRETKHILKDIACNFVPKDLINRPKMGFAIPRAQWLRSDLKELSHDLLTDIVAENRGWFNQLEVKKILDIHSRGTNLDSVIWPMLMLELWARNWLDQ
jgi:asparagine synthase (glutamine-hydrolysing)